MPDMSNCYYFGVTQSAQTHTNILRGLAHSVLLCSYVVTLEGCSIDLYREHLLNQLGRSGQWQTTSLLFGVELAPLSFEAEGEMGN